MKISTEGARTSQSGWRFVSMLTTPQESQTARASNTGNSAPPWGNVPASVSAPSSQIIDMEKKVAFLVCRIDFSYTGFVLWCIALCICGLDTIFFNIVLSTGFRRENRVGSQESSKEIKKDILSQYATRKLLNLVMDTEDGDGTILSFYKMAHVE